MAEPINDKNMNKPAGDSRSLTPDETGGGFVPETSFWKQLKDLYARYKSQIGLAVLVIYVITLAIATIIEILEH